VLTPDFQGNDESLRIVVAARPEILNHNIETCRGSIALPSPAAATNARSSSCGGQRDCGRIRLDAGDQDRHHRRHGEEMHELLAVFRDLVERGWTS